MSCSHSPEVTCAECAARLSPPMPNFGPPLGTLFVCERHSRGGMAINLCPWCLAGERDRYKAALESIRSYLDDVQMGEFDSSYIWEKVNSALTPAKDGEK